MFEIPIIIDLVKVELVLNVIFLMNGRLMKSANVCRQNILQNFELAILSNKVNYKLKVE